MPEDARDDGPIARARAQGRRFAHGLVIVIAVLFIGASTGQIIRAVFAVGLIPTATSEPCARGVTRLARALGPGYPRETDDPRARQAGSNAPSPRPPLGDSSANDLRVEGRSPWADADGIARACATASEGLDAWAALQRMRLAQLELARRDRTDVELLERDVSAHLPADLR
jgi:hypothetical protein